MKTFSRESRSLYTINKMNSYKDFFDSYIWSEKEKFEAVFNDLTEDNNSSDILISEKDNLLAEKNELLKIGYQLF